MAVFKSLKHFDSYEHLTGFLNELNMRCVDYDFDIIKELDDGAVIVLITIRG